MRILITGAAGFIGHHVVEHLLKNTDWSIIVLDRLSYAGSLDRLRDIEAFDDSRVLTLTADFTKPIEENLAKEIGQVDFVLHMGAETHVDNSITDPMKFVQSNVVGTVQMLEFARTLEGLKKFVYFSTDEVFGPAPGKDYKEGDRHNPSNPYSAAKSAGEQFCVAYANTYKLPIIITNTMNVFGERQHPEKYIPKIINKTLSSELLKVHSHPDKKRAGTRFYIHARNVADAVLFILENVEEVVEIDDVTKGKFNIVGEKEVDNLSLAWMVSDVVGKELKYEMVDFHSSRPGHDLRYALSGKKLKKLGWQPQVSFEQSLEKTVNWFLENDRWLKA